MSNFVDFLDGYRLQQKKTKGFVMPSINVQRSIHIKSSVEDIHAILSDFSQWRIWSPWLITEPEAKMKIAADGQSYLWQGKRIGQGSMQLINVEQQELDDTIRLLNLTLTFLKPWKSTAQVQFQLVQQGDDVKVTWSMQSSLPLFIFWLKKMMQAVIGMDYERGLLMLKDYIETGEVVCQLAIQGTTEYLGGNYIGIKRKCDKADMVNTILDDFNTLTEFMNNNANLEILKGCTIYHKFDLVSEEVEYTAGVIINRLPTQLPEPLVVGNIPVMKVFSVKQTGPYHHLGNAWSMLMGLQRAKAFKPVKIHPPFELYHNHPQLVDEKKLTTEIVFACK